MKEQKKNIFIIDGHALSYRAYYAIRGLATSRGVPTNAVFGFINILRKIRKEYTPDRVIVAFDVKGPTQRHKKYDEYKATRKPVPEDLIDQIEHIKEVLRAYDIPVCQAEGYEADDVIATLAEKARKKGLNVIIVTSDKDAMQLVDDKIKVLNPYSKGENLMDADAVEQKFGVEPKKMKDLMALTGDVTDNIPGVKGVGPASAQKLIKEFGTIKGVYENLDRIKPEGLRKKLEEGRSEAELSLDLVVLDKNVPVDMDIEALLPAEPDNEKLRKLFRKFEFKELLKELFSKNGPRSEINVNIIETPDGIRGFMNALKGCEVYSFCCDLPDEAGSIPGVSFVLGEDDIYYLPMGVMSGAGDAAKDAIFSGRIKKTGYDLKKDMHTFERYGIHIGGDIFDVMIADYLIDPSRSGYDLSSVSMRYLEHGIDEADNTSGSDITDPERIQRTCLRNMTIFKLYRKLGPVLERKGLAELFEQVEMPLVTVLKNMEAEGVAVDVSFMKEQSEKIRKRLEEISEKIFSLAGENFNINSHKQLGHILYEKLKLPIYKKTRTGASTDESVLRKLRDDHPIPAYILEYREINKLKTAYYDSITALVDESSGVLHANFNQAVTATGRLSSSEPNLQNIPIKNDFGRKIRKAFVPKRKDMCILAADYSQIELRILAHFSDDAELTKAFNNNEDVHRHTAALIFDSSPEEITDLKRSIAKTVNFGIIYGMSPFGLSKDLDISVAEAGKFIGAYFRRYQGVNDFIERTKKECSEKGFVTTLLNRRRYLPEISDANEQVRSFAERAAVNTVIQGSAADLIKLAMIKCDERFADTDTKMIIQVHDELLFETPKKRIETAARTVKDIMERTMELKVPLVVKVEAGDNWLEMKKIEF